MEAAATLAFPCRIAVPALPRQAVALGLLAGTSDPNRATNRVSNFRQARQFRHELEQSGYPSSAFGLFDLGGNVWEWCSTWYRTNLIRADLSDPAIVRGSPALLDDGGGGQQNRVVRGGSWHAQRQVDLRTRFRGIGGPRIRFDDFGFRCVLEREEAAP